MDQDISEQLRTWAQGYWLGRINAPTEVFNALVDQYVEACKREQEEMALAESETERLGEPDGLNIVILQASDVASWYCNDLIRLEASIHKLSRGFPLESDALKLFFSETLRFHDDVYNALNSPDTPAPFYPNSIHYTAVCLVKMMEPYLAGLEEHENTTLIEMRNDPFTGHIPIESVLHNDALFVSLERAQDLEKTMPIIATTLRGNRHYNLATIIEHFGRKGAAMSRDIIANAQTAPKPS